jgi:hypothetical protein
MFLRKVIFFFNLFFWSISYRFGMMLLLSICWATLLLSLFPNPLRDDLAKSSEVALATFLYSASFFFLTSAFSISLMIS